LYGFNGYNTSFGFLRYDISTNGVTRTDVTPGLISGFHSTIEFASGLVFASSGTVLEPETLTTITNIPDVSASALCKPDTASGLLSFLTQESGTWIVRQYAHSNYALLREIRIPGVQGQPKSFTRWGTDGLAFLTTSNQLFLVRPSLAMVDLAVECTSWPSQGVAGQTFQIALSITNNGPSFEPDAILTNAIPNQTVLVSARASQGTNLVAGNSVIFFLGAMASNLMASVVITLQATNASDTILTNTAIITGAFLDCVPKNNSAFAIFTIEADSDGDGIPDDWMMQYFGHVTGEESDLSRPSDDADGDGMSNLEEYLAGTNPRDAASSLRLEIVPQPPVLSFMAITGKSYTVEFTDSLGSNAWQRLFDVPALDAPPVRQITLPVSSDSKLRFYRVITPQLP
jgi:hypothetical protein